MGFQHFSTSFSVFTLGARCGYILPQPRKAGKPGAPTCRVRRAGDRRQLGRVLRGPRCSHPPWHSAFEWGYGGFHKLGYPQSSLDGLFSLFHAKTHENGWELGVPPWLWKTSYVMVMIFCIIMGIAQPPYFPWIHWREDIHRKPRVMETPWFHWGVRSHGRPQLSDMMIFPKSMTIFPFAMGAGIISEVTNGPLASSWIYIWLTDDGHVSV